MVQVAHRDPVPTSHSPETQVALHLSYSQDSHPPTVPCPSNSAHSTRTRARFGRDKPVLAAQEPDLVASSLLYHVVALPPHRHPAPNFPSNDSRQTAVDSVAAHRNLSPPARARRFRPPPADRPLCCRTVGPAAAAVVAAASKRRESGSATWAAARIANVRRVVSGLGRWLIAGEISTRIRRTW